MIYLDNASTTWPKPKEIQYRVMDSFESYAGSSHRTYRETDIIDGIRKNP